MVAALAATAVAGGDNAGIERWIPVFTGMTIKAGAKRVPAFFMAQTVDAFSRQRQNHGQASIREESCV
jgi:hypothetical protein